MTVAEGGGPPDAAAIRAARANISYHLRYIGYLAARRNWLAGARSELRRPRRRGGTVVVDYLGEVPWEEDATAKAWYARMKSRPSFRAVLADHGARHARRRPTTPTSTSDDDPAELKAFLVADCKARGLRRRRRRRARCDPARRPPRLRAFLADGHHGTMDWLAGGGRPPRRPAGAVAGGRRRRHARPELRAGRRSAAGLARRDRATISVYARNRDYHDLIKGKLKVLAGRFAARTGSEVKVFVDTAPLMEKPLAEAAGLGWQGKHTNLVSREFGSWLFLGAILTEVELPPDAAETDHCGTCRACLDICPTNAFPGALPARCPPLHLLPHHRARRPDPARVPQGDRQPHLWLRRLPRRLPVEQVRAGHARGEARRARRSRRAAARRTRGARRCRLPQRFSGSPIKRIGRDRFVRNVLIAIGNSGDAGAGRRRRAASRRCLAAGPRRRGLGAVATASRAIRRAGARASHGARPTPTSSPSGGA